MADPELVKLLLQGRETWNHWREQQLMDWPARDLREPTRKNADLNNADFYRVDLSNADLDGTNLSNMDLYRVDLSNANLNGADLSNASLGHARLRNAHLIGANLRGASLSEADLRGAHLNIYQHDAQLSEEVLKDAYLVGANLSGADLSEADLRGANLRVTSLRHANLNGANLSGAYFRAAIFDHANLSESLLVNAHLSATFLFGTNLRGADLRGADLSDAYLRGATFANLDLRQTRGLLSINYAGPSSVELWTVQLPQDGSALHFLRGCGVPDEWIDDYRARRMQPIQYYSCFISYSSRDEMLARRLHADLQDRGVRCWFAPHDMKIGASIRPTIEQAIHMQDKVLLILSQHAVASTWVRDEVEAPMEKERRQQREVLFPIRIDEAVMKTSQAWAANLRRQINIGDFTRWTEPEAYQQAFEQLLRDLKKAGE